jgi:hypothetical protein
VLLSSGTSTCCAAAAAPPSALPPKLKNFPTSFGMLPSADRPLRTHKQTSRAARQVEVGKAVKRGGSSGGSVGEVTCDGPLNSTDG